ncbi:MAG: hypothetical protein Q9160_005310 [Pyrenula sp. 1 TL-2023]
MSASGSRSSGQARYNPFVVDDDDDDDDSAIDNTNTANAEEASNRANSPQQPTALKDRIDFVQNLLQQQGCLDLVIGKENDPQEAGVFTGIPHQDLTISQQISNFKERSKLACKLIREAFADIADPKLKDRIQSAEKPTTVWNHVYVAFFESFQSINVDRISFAKRPSKFKINDRSFTKEFFNGYRHVTDKLSICSSEVLDATWALAARSMSPAMRFLLCISMQYVHPDTWSIDHLVLHWRLWEAITGAIFGSEFESYRVQDDALFRNSRSAIRSDRQRESPPTKISVDQAALQRQLRKILLHGYINWAATVHLYRTKDCSRHCQHRKELNLHEEDLRMLPVGEVVRFFNQNLKKIDIRPFEPIVGGRADRGKGNGKRKVEHIVLD